MMKHPEVGLTLIEVMIALAIVAIALTAIIKATSQVLKGTAYLQDKTVAVWVGQQALNEIRVGAIKLSEEQKRIKKVIFLNKTWFWQAEAYATSNSHIDKVELNVFTKEPTEESVPLVSLETYRYHAQ